MLNALNFRTKKGQDDYYKAYENGIFPKMLKKKALANLEMPVLILFGENEFAFNIKKATNTAKLIVEDLEIETVGNASHLISVSSPVLINERILGFLK